MGLSSSQARLLNLTQRMHQLEYKAARLESMKLQMANESTRVYEDYLNALELSKVQVKTLTTDGAVTFVDVQNYGQFLTAGFALVFNNSIYTGTDGLQQIVNSIANITNPGGGTPAISNFETALTNVINSGYVTIVQKKPDGTWPTNTSAIDFPDFETSVSTNTSLQEITDEVALKKAEAKYEADMKRIDMKDRRYDSDLAALETERNAIKQEIDTLKTVAKDNVERTFKLFS